ncbi:MAG TPA: MFS transporter [Steroidobacteraceae bacterium]|nr:MFS transporter [Steroidobacteraceae bacterium]HNS28844.1 MFS transporter [Steroidobacteraceae bacterium]
MRNVWILTLAQAMAACGMLVMFAFGGIVGARIAPTAALATLPLSLGVVGVAAASIPAALSMQRFGRRPMFVLSALVAALAGLGCAWAVAHAHFGAFCAGALVLGANMAFVQQYRFAAAEYVDVPLVPRAIAAVLLGTLAAAFLGPEAGDRLRNIGGWPEFTGSFIAVAVFLVLSALTLLALGPPMAHALARHDGGRPLRQIVRQRAYLVALFAGLTSYAVMSFIMTATPISMHVIDGHDVTATKNVITSHLVAMYLPSLASGWLIARLGIARMMMAGIVCMLACIVIAAALGHAFLHYFSGLVLLGVGWNLLFVAATTLLTRTYSPAERFRAQGFNDFATFTSQAIASLAAGAAISSIGWLNVNLVCIPLLLAMLVAVSAWRRQVSR